MTIRVKCIADSMAEMPEQYLDAGRLLNRETTFSLTVGKTYAVYATTNYVGGWLYYIEDDGHEGYSSPSWVPESVFQVVESERPKHWIRREHDLQDGRRRIVESFPAWANDIYFYDKLTDGNPDEVLAFEFERKRLKPPDPPEDYFEWGLSTI